MNEPISKSAPIEGRNATLLAGRLRELGIAQTGLPSHVVAHLREIVRLEAAQIQNELDAEIVLANKRATGRLVKRISLRLTFKTIGKAFAKLKPIATKSVRVSAYPTGDEPKGDAS